MTSKKIITISEARKRLFEIAEEVQKPGNFCTLTIEGEPKIIIIAKKEFDALMETIELLSNPELVRKIKKAEEEYAHGNYCSWNDVKQRLGIGTSSSGAASVVRSPKTSYRINPKK